MITASVTETRRRLSELIELARQGEEVVIIKDSRPVAALQPIEAADLQFSPRLSDRQAQRLLQMIESEPKLTFPSAAAAVRFLKKDIKKKR
ncbi:MAG: type II toxin-antitoxin system prevent-host-death family antitoxin [Acidobacteriota bacterium]